MVNLGNYLLCILCIVVTSANSQTQKGIDIDGELESGRSGSSISISADGNTLAIGEPGNEETFGRVRVFRWDGEWIQKGSDIDGEALGDLFGNAVSLSSDGNTLAIGAIFNGGGGIHSGHVRVYKWNGEEWIQKGIDIDGESEGDFSGIAVSISDNGNVVAIGAVKNNGIGEEAGHVRVYFWGFSSWIQRGIDIDGEAEGDRSGSAVSLSSDGNTVAIGAPWNEVDFWRQGHARIYSWDGSEWIQKGTDINGAGGEDHFGGAVSLSSDGNTVAIGAHQNSGSGFSAGHVRVYYWDGIIWTQKGTDLEGESELDRSGRSVDLSSDGNTLAIGATQNDDSADNAGHVRIWEWDGVEEWIQRGIDIDGEAEGDRSGSAVSLSADGNTVAIGAPFNSEEIESAGQVRIYEFCEDITNTISTVACNSYTVPSGDEMYLTSGVYMDTIPRAFNCGDSILTIDVTLNYVNVDVTLLTFDTLQADASGVGISYQWIDCTDSSEIVGATEQVFGAPINGNYAVILNHDGCVDTSACYEIEGVGVSEDELYDIKVYPNPSSGILYLESESTDLQIQSIQLFNSLGQIILTQKISDIKTNMNLSGFEHGIYLIVIETDKGRLYEKLILQ